MQFPGQVPLAGVIYSTNMSRADSALALALLHGLAGKREARVGGITVSGAGLQTAAFCDAVKRFYAGPGPVSNSNSSLPVGLAMDVPLPPDPPMVRAAMDRRDDKGLPVYPHSMDKLSDTGEPTALLRNALTAQADAKAVILLSSTATYLARMLDLQGINDLIAAKVKLLIVCDYDGSQDLVAARRIIAEWPTPIVFCSREVGEAVLYPATSIEKDFAWTSAHPVADAYRAYRPMPYDSTSMDMAAVLYAVRPEAGDLKLSGPGSIQVNDSGRFKFVPGEGGKHRALMVDEAAKPNILKIYTEIASAKPVPRPTPGQRQKKVDPVKPGDAVKPPVTKPS